MWLKDFMWQVGRTKVCGIVFHRISQFFAPDYKNSHSLLDCKNDSVKDKNKTQHSNRCDSFFILLPKLSLCKKNNCNLI